MNVALPAWLKSLLPARASVSQAERLRSGAGALVGIFITGLVGAAFIKAPSTALWLIAPMGASAVLLFGVPSSPLAQPWSIIGGNIVSALIGVACAKFVHEPAVAAALAIFLSIWAMLALHCLHPPSGAVALTAVLGGPEIHAAGFAFVWMPAALNSLVLIAVAVAYNKAAGRRYPHTQQIGSARPHGRADLRPGARLGFTPEDLMHSHAVHALPVVDRVRRVIGIVTRTDFLQHANLSDHGTLSKVLKDFLRRTTSSHSDKSEVVGQIMSAAPHTSVEDTPLADLVAQMSAIEFHHLPVVNTNGRLVGMVTQTDLVAALHATGFAAGHR